MKREDEVAVDDEDADTLAAYWALRVSEGPLDTVQQQSFIDWLAEDEDNPVRFEATVALLETIDSYAIAPDLIQHRRKALNIYHQAQAKRWKLPGTGRWIAPAMAATLFLGLGWSVAYTYLPKVYETHLGERQAVTLADGSKLSLDADTRVLVRYSSKRRYLVLERGRANFTVAHNPDRPFSVTSGKDEVIATGTAFSVEKLSGEVRVVLYEGHIRVLEKRSGALQPVLVAQHGRMAPVERILSAGHQLVIENAGAVASLAPVSETMPRSWEAGLLEFNDEPLSVAAERINRYATGRRIVVAPDAAQLRVNGAFTAGDTEAFVSGIGAIFPTKVTDNGEEITISLK